MWVVTGSDTSGNNIWTSTDGSVWNPVQAFIEGNSNNATYANGMWVVTGNSTGNNKIWTYKDGSGWSPVEAFGTGYSTNVFYVGGIWAVAGVDYDSNGYNLWTSTDGSVWTPVEAFIEGYSIRVAYGGGTWVVTGSDTSGNNIWTSTDGSGWTGVPSFGGGVGSNDAVYADGMWVVTSDYQPPTTTTTTVPPPCFVQGTRILTPTGYKRVEELQTRDIILTVDNRIVPIQMYSFTVKTATKDTAPYRIPAGALGKLLPRNDLHVSSRHAVKDWKGRWQIPKYLGTKAIQYGIGESVTYYHVECPNYYRDNLIAEGMEVESYKNRQGASGVSYIWDNTIGGWERLPPNKMRTVPANPTTWMLYTN